MTPDEAVAILKRQVKRLDPFRAEPPPRPWDDSAFQQWHRDTEVAVEVIFGAETRHLQDLRAVSYNSPSYSDRNAFLKGVDNATALLTSFINEIRDYGIRPHETLTRHNELIVERICNQFPQAVRRLRHRRADRPPLLMEDEYDVQYLLEALLAIEFEDIRSEEYTPSYAGGSSRIDFLLKCERIAIEVKRARVGLGLKEIGKQLIDDIVRYKENPNCQTLVCFVYDPDHVVENAACLQDLARDMALGQAAPMKVRVIVAPK